MGQISYGAIVLRGKCLNGYLGTKYHDAHVRYEFRLDGSELGSRSRGHSFFPDRNDVVQLEDKTPLVAIRILETPSLDETRVGCWFILRRADIEAGAFVRIGIMYENPSNGRGLYGTKLNAEHEKEAVELDIEII